MKPRALDIAAIFASVLAVGAFSAAAWSHHGAARDVVIEASGSSWIYPLDTDRVERVSGPLGVTQVVIRAGKASVEDSPCPDKLCVGMPAISSPGQWIACLPNRVFVRVRGGSGPDVDQLSY